MRVVLAAAAILVALQISQSYAQNTGVDELNKLRIAQALEQAGEFDKAMEFYHQLYQASPNNFVYFDGLRRSYTTLKKYDEAKILLNERLKSDPSNVVMMCQLGDVYFKNGQRDSGSVIWYRTLTVDPNNPNTYRVVAQTMAEDRLFDDAIKVYQKGEANSKTVFSNEIARLYFLDADYAGSLHELLRQLQTQRTPYVLPNIEAQVGSYSSSKEALEQFTTEMEKEVAEKPDNPDFRRLIGFLYMEMKNYAAAYSTYKWLDEHSGSPGSELLQFAAIAFNDEAYDVAAGAYKEVAGLSEDNSIVVQSLMGNANSLRKWGEKNYADDERPCSISDTLKELSQALSAYGKIIEEYPNTQALSASVSNSVELEMRYFHDFSRAEKLFLDYGSILRPLANDWALLRIQLYMKEGKFQDAFSTALEVLQPKPSVVGSSLEKIEFQAAVALYYLGLYDSSVFYLNKIISNPMSDAANDAIQLMNMITNNRGNPPALKQFASASAMEESNRVSEAAAVLEKLLNEYPNVPLSDNARFDLAADYCKMGNVAAALKNYSVLAEDTTGVVADRADFRICRIYQGTLHQKEKAVAEYESFLVRFPNSIYQNKVREILRDLLGENS